MATQKQVLVQIRDEIRDSQSQNFDHHNDVISFLFVFVLLISFFLGWIAGER